MPFLAEKHVDIPTKDILSWSFDELLYDEAKPVSAEPHHLAYRRSEPDCVTAQYRGYYWVPKLLGYIIPGYLFSK